MKTLLFLLILFSQTVFAGNRLCQSLFLPSDPRVLSDQIKAQILDSKKVSYDSAKQLVTLSLEGQNREVWLRLIARNEKRGAKILAPPKAISSESDLYVYLVNLIRKELEVSLRSSVGFSFLRAFVTSPRPQNYLVDSILNEVLFLKDLQSSFAMDAAVESQVLKSSGDIQRWSGLFWRLFAANFKDTQVSIYKSYSKSAAIYLKAREMDPENLKYYIGNKIRLESSLNWAFKHFTNVQFSLLLAASACILADTYSGSEYYKSATTGQTDHLVVPQQLVPMSDFLSEAVKSPESVNIQTLEALTTPESLSRLSPREQAFFNEIKQDLQNIK